MASTNWMCLSMAVAVCTGCYEGNPAGGGDDATQTGGAATESSGGSGDGTAGDETGEPDDPDLPEDCVGLPPELGATPIRRLTRDEYNNTIRDLLGDASRPADAFSSDESVDGFAANVVAPASQSQVEAYVDAAEALAETAVQTQLDTWIDCDAADNACIDPLLLDLGLRAFRRPLLPSEHADLIAVYNAGRSDWDARKGVEMALAAMLASPQFLYHVEVGAAEDAEGDAVPLTDYEVAARLSYFIWGSLPDDALFDAAAAGELGVADAIETQARRMLDDPRAADTLETFHRQWLQLDTLDELPKDAAAFPQWSPELGAAMRAETVAFAEHVIREDDATLTTLLTAPYSFVDDELAPLYGVAPPGGSLTQTDLDPQERAGLLTQLSVLASKAHASEASWVLRGKLVRTQLLCQELPSPPDDADFSEANDPDRLIDEECAGCHTLMDPIGQGFDAYDAIGQFVGGASAGEVLGAADTELNGPFTGPVELAQRLAASPAVHSCVAQKWFVYATRRRPDDADGCSVGHIENIFTGAGLDLRELIIGMTRTAAFRHRNGAG